MTTQIKPTLAQSLKPYLTKPAFAALAFGISSGFPYTLLAATLTQWLSEEGIARKSVAIFSWVLFTYNLKVVWAPLIDTVKVPILSRFLGQRQSWLVVSSILLVLAIFNLASQNPKSDLRYFAICAILVGIAGATFDIVIDAFRIEILKANEQGVGAALSQYGWRLGALITSNIVLTIAAATSWKFGYMAAASVVLFGLIAGLWIGEPTAHEKAIETKKGEPWLKRAIIDPFADFFMRAGAWGILLFILMHKIGDTLANLMLRNMLVGLKFTKDEIKWADVNFGTVCLLLGILLGSYMFNRLGVKRSVMISLVLMMVSNLSFAVLAQAGHSIPLLAAANGFENFASGIGGVAIVGYLSILCNVAFTATQFAMLSAASSILGRFLTGAFGGSLVDTYGFTNFYLITTLAALPGVLIFAWLWRAGLVIESPEARDEAPKKVAS
jgi:MFS transporter, PAT family, beta-lactamase induction signal transducer AmpG